MSDNEEGGLLVNGIVARRDGQPYVQILTMKQGIVAQFSMAEARSFASDILLMCARTEADAMVHKFFEGEKFPPGAANAIMVLFREFRHKLDIPRFGSRRMVRPRPDMEPVGRSETDPGTEEI